MRGDVEANTSSEDWEAGVEVLQLNHMKLTSLSGIENLSNLRKASFIDNELDRIIGFKSCRLLEELSLEGNNIGKIEGI